MPLNCRTWARDRQAGYRQQLKTLNTKDRSLLCLLQPVSNPSIAGNQGTKRERRETDVNVLRLTRMALS